MDNPEKLVPWGTQDTGRRQTNYKNKTQKKKDQQHGLAHWCLRFTASDWPIGVLDLRLLIGPLVSFLDNLSLTYFVSFYLTFQRLVPIRSRKSKDRQYNSQKGRATIYKTLHK
jgi:hypothetical protein